MKPPLRRAWERRHQAGNAATLYKRINYDMIHSHWLCYKYFYGSVFFSFFLSFFSKEAVWMSLASRTHIAAPKITECESWRKSSEFAHDLSPASHRWARWSPERDEGRFWRSQSERLAGFGLAPWSPESQREVHSSTPCHSPAWAKGAPWTGCCLLQSDLSPRVPSSQGTWGISFPALTGISDHHVNEKVFLALLLPEAFFQLTFRAAGFKLRGQNNFFPFFSIEDITFNKPLVNAFNAWGTELDMNIMDPSF